MNNAVMFSSAKDEWANHELQFWYWHAEGRIKPVERYALFGAIEGPRLAGGLRAARS